MNKAKSLIKANEKYLKRKQSNVYKVVESLGLLINSFLCEGYSGFKKKLEKKWVNVEIRRKTSRKERYPQEWIEYKGEQIAVYTVLFGNIDSIIDPLVKDSNCDYYIITDQELSSVKCWKKLDVEMEVVKAYSARQKNRYYKMHAHKMFPDYEYSIYIDANIAIYGKLSELIKYINPLTGIGLHNMPNRGSIYEEIFARSLIDPRDADLLERQKKDYLNQGFYSEEGMFECNVLAMKNSSSKCAEIMESWWEEYKKYPARDQVSFPYILWKKGVSQNDIGILGNCMRLNPYFRIKEHIIQ